MRNLFENLSNLKSTIIKLVVINARSLRAAVNKHCYLHKYLYSNTTFAATADRREKNSPKFKEAVQQE